MGEKRKSRRLNFRKRIRVGKENPTFMGYAVNISEHGLEIEARNIFPAGTRIVISFQEDGDSGNDGQQEIRIEGVVKWSTRLIGCLSGNMGVEVTDDPADIVKTTYQERINKLVKE